MSTAEQHRENTFDQADTSMPIRVYGLVYSPVGEAVAWRSHSSLPIPEGWEPIDRHEQRVLSEPETQVQDGELPPPEISHVVYKAKSPSLAITVFQYVSRWLNTPLRPYRYIPRS